MKKPLNWVNYWTGLKSLLSTTLSSLVCKGHLTPTLLLNFRNDIQKALNWNEIIKSVLINYIKAFNTINHKTLLEKLVLLDFSNRTIKIIMRCLSKWHQYVQIDDQTLPESPVHFGVPQGSILGPIFFNIYVAELPSCIDPDSIQYALDTTSYRTCRPNGILLEICQLKNHIKIVWEWSPENGIVFNNDKLKCITFSSKGKVNDKSYLISSNRKSIAEETTIKL